MSKRLTSIRLPEITDRQLAELASATGLNTTELITTAIDRMYREESNTMEIIKVGEINDLYLYAVKGEHGGYVPLNEGDLEFVSPDAKIYYDSGLYPSITQEELPQYICNKAQNL